MPQSDLGKVEGDATEASLHSLRRGVRLKDGLTRPAEVERIADPTLWPRDPPIRFRKSVPDCWLKLTIREGRNRQVRRMTAAIGHPTLRLVRRSEEHTSELQSLMRISYAVFCLKKKHSYTAQHHI